MPAPYEVCCFGTTHKQEIKYCDGRFERFGALRVCWIAGVVLEPNRNAGLRPQLGSHVFTSRGPREINVASKALHQAEQLFVFRAGDTDIRRHGETWLESQQDIELLGERDIEVHEPAESTR